MKVHKPSSGAATSLKRLTVIFVSLLTFTSMFTLNVAA